VEESIPGAVINSRFLARAPKSCAGAGVDVNART